MIDRFLLGIANARTFVGKLWVLTRPFWFAQDLQAIQVFGRSFTVKEAWIARGLLAVILGLSVLIVFISKLINDWNARFFNALQNRDAEAFRAELIYWVVIAVCFIIAVVYRLWLTQIPDDPLAPLAERRLLPRLAARPHLLPHGADQPRHRQPRAAHRAGRQRFRHRYGAADARAVPAGPDARHLRRGAVEPLERLRPAAVRQASSSPAT